ncbi:MAG: ethanolamine utilization Fe-S center protein eut [Firmicutes bacterium]|nr:ethanolamine utilization Fe-S center protein eut [Bacillota bacterium]
MSSTILEAVKSAGVVGAGGAGFPTWMKLKSSPEIIIVNGAECEPLLRVDQMLMARYAKEITYALAKIVEATGAKTGVFGLKKKYGQAIAQLDFFINEYQNLRICTLDDIYPAGDEQVLVYTVTGKHIQPGQIPLSVGAVVINVETLLNVYMALQNKPVTHKYVTVAGAVKKPYTLKVPLGMAISELLKVAGGTTIDKFVLINGGPCMGKQTQINEVVTKTTKGILVLPEDHPVIIGQQRSFSINLKRALSVCSQCQRCSELCPRHLLGHPIRPHMAMRMVAYNKPDVEAVKEAMLCCECGACDLYACPFDLSPRQVNRMLKQEIRKVGLKISWENQNCQPHPERSYRLIPIKRLINRLGLHDYDVPAPWYDEMLNISEVRLPLLQHIGTPAKPIVKVGDMVKIGQVIAEVPADALGVNIHSSIDGVIRDVDREITIGKTGGM